MTSRGEQKIIDILKKEGVSFQREYTFPDLKSRKKRPLRFDFALLNKYGNIFALIEFDGEQHFTFNKHFSKNRQNFKYKQEMDVLKNEYALNNNYSLYRIPFYDLEKLNTYSDLFKYNYLVVTKWHCFELKYKKKL